MLVQPGKLGLLVVHLQHFNCHLFQDVVPSVSQLDGETILHTLRVVVHVHHTHSCWTVTSTLF